MKVLVLMGSPRKSGNIAKMLELTIDAARSAGHSVETVDLYALGLTSCTGCMKCRQTGICVIQDSIHHLREQLYTCGAVVMAAPTYWGNVPGTVKNVFDRLSGAVMDEGPHGIPKGKLSKNQKYILLTACTTPPPFDRIAGQSSGALRAMREFFKTAGMRQGKTVVYAATKGKTGLPQAVIKQINNCFR